MRGDARSHPSACPSASSPRRALPAAGGIGHSRLGTLLIKGMFVLSYWSRCNIGSLTSKPGTSILEKLCIAILEGGKAWEGSRPPGGRPAPPDARADGEGPLVHAGSRPTRLSRAAVQVSVICRLSPRGPTFVSSRFRATRSGECGWLPGGGFEARHGASAFVASDAVLGARRPRRPRLRPPPCKPLRCALLTPVSVALGSQSYAPPSSWRAPETR